MLDRIEWLLEKATEVGVNEVSFLNCAFSERKLLKLARLEKIVISAIKQSRKAIQKAFRRIAASIVIAKAMVSYEEQSFVHLKKDFIHHFMYVTLLKGISFSCW
jgi:RsmE family RNA methyltransferase